MIQTKSDLRAYIAADYKAYGRAYPVTVKERLRDWRIRDTNLRFMVNLRYLEYWWNRTEVSSGISKLLAKIVRAVYVRRYERLRAWTGIDIWINSVGPGLHVSHGKCLVNPLAKLGAGCKINSDVTVGAQGRYDLKRGGGWRPSSAIGSISVRGRRFLATFELLTMSSSVPTLS